MLDVKKKKNELRTSNVQRRTSNGEQMKNEMKSDKLAGTRAQTFFICHL